VPDVFSKKAINDRQVKRFKNRHGVAQYIPEQQRPVLLIVRNRGSDNAPLPTSHTYCA
jgi:hypothetical protein